MVEDEILSEEKAAPAKSKLVKITRCCRDDETLTTRERI